MKFMDRFKEWQNWVHYILLGIGTAIFLFYMGVPQFYNDTDTLVLLIIALTVIDSIVHYLFWVAPKPFRWRD